MVFDLILVHFFQFQILIGVKIVVIFGVDNSLSVYMGNNKKDTLVLNKSPTQ